MKWDFFQVVALLVQLYGCTTWTFTKSVQELLDRNSTSLISAVLNKSRETHPTKQQVQRN